LQTHAQIVRASEFVPLLIQHGANVDERDHRGATLLHWACGTGHLDSVEELIPYFEYLPHVTCQRDDATVLHWCAAGCTARDFGIGGHVHIAEYLIDRVRTSTSRNDDTHTTMTTTEIDNFINHCTYEGNSALMWAAWSGSMDTVKLLVQNNADTALVNRNGCTVAHWAASGGNVAVCQYLHDTAKVDFNVQNYAGNTPMSHAMTFQRMDVIQWLEHIDNASHNLHRNDDR
jgi:ankyrin repeat protein